MKQPRPCPPVISVLAAPCPGSRPIRPLLFLCESQNRRRKAPPRCLAARRRILKLLLELELPFVQKPQNNKPTRGSERLFFFLTIHERTAEYFLVATLIRSRRPPFVSGNNATKPPRRRRGSTRGPLTVLLFHQPRLPRPSGRSRSDHPQRPPHLRPASAGTSPRLTTTARRLRRPRGLQPPRHPQHHQPHVDPGRHRPALRHPELPDVAAHQPEVRPPLLSPGFSFKKGAGLIDSLAPGFGSPRRAARSDDHSSSSMTPSSFMPSSPSLSLAGCSSGTSRQVW